MPYKNREKQNEATHRWYLKNKEKRAAYSKARYEAKKEAIQKQKLEYMTTPNGRASRLIAAYNIEDSVKNRGKGNLTAQWVVENIFTKPCAHCGKEGWKIIGCNRLDNSKPHTMDNVEPCCKECNDKMYGVETAKKVYQYTLDYELVQVWNSIAECSRNGFNLGHISECCRGERNKHKGYIWSFTPL